MVVTDYFVISGEIVFEPGMNSIWIHLMHCIPLTKVELLYFFES